MRGPLSPAKVDIAVFDLAAALYPDVPGDMKSYCDALDASPTRVADALEALLEEKP